MYIEAFSLTLDYSTELRETVEGQWQNSTLFSPLCLITQPGGIPLGTYMSLLSCIVSEVLLLAPTIS